MKDKKELLDLIKGNPNQFIKCSFRIDSRRQQRYHGHLPTPDSPDVRIPGDIRGVHEDDVVVVELPDKRGQEDGEIFGSIKGKFSRTGRIYIHAE